MIQMNTAMQSGSSVLSISGERSSSVLKKATSKNTEQDLDRKHQKQTNEQARQTN